MPGQYRQNGMVGQALGMDPNQGLAMGLWNRFGPGHQQQQDPAFVNAMTPDQAPATEPGPAIGGEGAAIDSFAQGKVVTSPTLAMIGDKGPEAVVPLTDQPGNKTSTAMLGAGGIRTRYRHPGGPNASHVTAPMHQNLPLAPSSFRR